MCHYNFHDFEGRRYYSTYYASAIIIPVLFEICHYVRLEMTWAHCQVYRGAMYIRMDKIALAHSLSLIH
jgi:hypothetical protein